MFHSHKEKRSVLKRGRGDKWASPAQKKGGCASCRVSSPGQGKKVTKGPFSFSDGGAGQ